MNIGDVDDRDRVKARAITSVPRIEAVARSAWQPAHRTDDLHEALLKAAERVLERDGLAGLTLRAVAREAGVSHAGT